jgi:hypothetical protein
LPAVCRDGFGLQVMVALPEFQKSVHHRVRCYGGRWSRLYGWLSSWWLSVPNIRRERCPTQRAADRASPWWYGAGWLAMVLVGGGVLLVRPAANANRWAAPTKDDVNSAAPWAHDKGNRRSPSCVRR